MRDTNQSFADFWYGWDRWPTSQISQLMPNHIKSLQGIFCTRKEGKAMSKRMSPDDPAYWMLTDGFETKPNLEIYNKDCYICNDPEFAQMGLPLCFPCLICGEHVAADDYICVKGHEQPTDPQEELLVREKHGLEITEELKAQAASMQKQTDVDDVFSSFPRRRG